MAQGNVSSCSQNSLIVYLKLVRLQDHKYYIKEQHDLYSVQECPGRFLPYGFTVIELLKLFNSFFIALLVAITQLLGVWRPE